MKLIRHKQTPHATFSRLYADDGVEVACCIERPWVDADENGKRDPDVSRIVPGRYRAIRRESPKRGYPVWWLCGVPDVTSAHFPDEPTATTCQIHKANVASELNGCIGIGTAFGVVNGQPGITGSRLAFDKFMTETKDHAEIWIEIEEQYPPRIE